MKQVSAISMLVLVALVLSIMQVCVTNVEADCDHFEAAEGHPCWNDWRKRDRRCGHLGEGAKFSFGVILGRCYCCRI